MFHWIIRAKVQNLCQSLLTRTSKNNSITCEAMISHMYIIRYKNDSESNVCLLVQHKYELEAGLDNIDYPFSQYFCIS